MLLGTIQILYNQFRGVRGVLQRGGGPPKKIDYTGRVRLLTLKLIICQGRTLTKQMVFNESMDGSWVGDCAYSVDVFYICLSLTAHPNKYHLLKISTLLKK